MPKSGKENRMGTAAADLSGPTLADELNEIALRCARRPALSMRSEEEILGYDEIGVPAN